MAMKRSFLQLIALLLGAIALVNCSGSPSCVLISNAATPVQAFGRAPAAVGANGCPVGTGGGGGGNGACSDTLTPADVLFGQGSTGAITTLAINTPGSNLALMCTTANAGQGELAVANVTATSKNFLYALSIKAGTIDGFAIGHVPPVSLTAVGAFSIWAANGLHTVVEMQADPSGRFLTVTDSVASLVHVLLIDSTLGTLMEAPGSPFSVANALFTAVGATGEFLYVTDQSDAQISVFLIDVTSLTQVLTLSSTLQEPTHNPANAPISMQVNLAGTFLYTANTASISFYAIDPINGSLSGTGSPVSFVPQFNPQLLTMDVSGTFLYALGAGTEGVLGFTMNANGSLTLISNSSFASGLSVSDMLVNPLGGQMYLLITGGINVYALGSGTGVLTPPTGAPAFTSSSLNLAAAFVQ
jgi:6-phosphogluconolactonase (cycloisomerase 2 family)